MVLRSCGDARVVTLVWGRAPRLSVRRRSISSSAKLAEEFLFVHPVLKSFAPVDEDHGNLIVIQPPDFCVGVHVDFTPAKPAPPVQLDQTLFDDLAEMTSL